MDGLKIWKVFGEKYCIVRTSSIFADERGRMAPLMYLGYFVDADDKFMYLAPTCEKEKIVTAIELETIDEISLYQEEQESVREPAKILSIAPAATTESKDPNNT